MFNKNLLCACLSFIMCYQAKSTGKDMQVLENIPLKGNYYYNISDISNIQKLKGQVEMDETESWNGKLERKS